MNAKLSKLDAVNPGRKSQCGSSTGVIIRLALLLLFGGAVMLNICFLAERTFSFWTDALHPMQVLVGILISITGVRDWGIRMRNALALGMGGSCLNSAVVGYLMICGKSEITGIKISPFLLAVSQRSFHYIAQKYLGSLPKYIPTRPLFIWAELAFFTFRGWLRMYG